MNLEDLYNIVYYHRQVELKSVHSTALALYNDTTVHLTQQTLCRTVTIGK
jgi:hypothetical protein